MSTCLGPEKRQYFHNESKVALTSGQNHVCRHKWEQIWINGERFGTTLIWGRSSRSQIQILDYSCYFTSLKILHIHERELRHIVLTVMPILFCTIHSLSKQQSTNQSSTMDCNIFLYPSTFPEVVKNWVVKKRKPKTPSDFWRSFHLQKLQSFFSYYIPKAKTVFIVA